MSTQIKEKFHLLSIISFAFSILISFQNCSEFGPESLIESAENSTHSATNTSSFSSTMPAGDCSQILINEFFKPEGYYHFLQTNCKVCHNGSSEDKPGFASDNKEIAWQKFFLKEISSDSAISKKALSSHQSGITGPQHTSVIEALKSALSLQKEKYNQCVGKLTTQNLSLKTDGLSLEPVADSGMTLSPEDKEFLRTEKATYFEGGSYKEQVFQLNPYMRIIYDESSNRWKTLTLKKFLAPKLTSEEAALTRSETYTYTQNSQPKSKTFTLNPFQRIQVDPETKFPTLVEHPRSVLYVFDLARSAYTPENPNDQPPVSFSVEMYRTTSVTPIKKIYNIVESTTRTIPVERIIGYNQIVDPFIVVRKPSFKITSTLLDPVYKFKKLSFLLNDLKVPDATVYHILNATICYSTKTTIMNNNNSQILVFDKVSATDRLAFEFEEVTSLFKANAVCNPDEDIPEDLNLPETITYNELIGAGSLGIFYKNCLNCHSASGASGGFDISTYSKAKSSVTRIIDRMNDTSNPMPRSGLVDIRSREIVKKWVSLGMPN